MQRILQRTSAALTWSPVDSDGEPSLVDPGTVTVTITDSAGVELHADAATTSDGVERTYTLSTTDTATLDVLTATWKVAGNVVAETQAAIVGGYYFTLAELRASHKTVLDNGKWTNALLLKLRNEVEESFESWTQMSWVPRFSVSTVHAGLADVQAIRNIRWIRHYSDNDTFTEGSAAEVADTHGTAWGSVHGWCHNYGRTVIGVEHGMNEPPADLKAAAMRYCQRLATRRESGLSDRAQSYTTPEGMTVNVGRIGTDWRPTGDEIIDEVLRRPDIDHRGPSIG